VISITISIIEWDTHTYSLIYSKLTINLKII